MTSPSAAREVRSALGVEAIPAIGLAKRRKALLRRLGSVEGMHGATVDELAAVEGMTRKAAETLAAHL